MLLLLHELLFLSCFFNDFLVSFQHFFKNKKDIFIYLQIHVIYMYGICVHFHMLLVSVFTCCCQRWSSHTCFEMISYVCLKVLRCFTMFYNIQRVWCIAKFVFESYVVVSMHNVCIAVSQLVVLSQSCR